MKKAAEPLSIILRGGTYYLPQTLVLEAEDSGTAAGPVVFQAAPGESVVISGGRRLELKWYDSGRSGVKAALLPEVKEGKLDFDQLFLDGRRQRMARYPNYNPAARNYGGTAADAISPAQIEKLVASRRRFRACPACLRMGRLPLPHYGRGRQGKRPAQGRLAE